MAALLAIVELRTVVFRKKVRERSFITEVPAA